MITVSKQENGVLFTFTNSDKYLYGSGTIEVPFNSLSIIQDESDNITLRKSASNDIFLSARYDTDFGYASKEEAVNALKEILYDEAGISEEEVQQMIDAATSGIPSSEVVEQLRRDVNAVSGEVDTKQDILTAGENITISGNVISADAGNNIIELTQAEYDALETKDPEALYIITDAQEINMNDYYTKSEVYNKQEVDAAYGTAYQTLTAHTADTTVHFTGTQKSNYDGLEAQYYVDDNWDVMSMNVFNDFTNDYSAAMGQFDQRISANTSAIATKADTSAVTAVANDVQTVSGQVQTKVATSDFNAYSAATATALGNKQDKLQFYGEDTEQWEEKADEDSDITAVFTMKQSDIYMDVSGDEGSSAAGVQTRIDARVDNGVLNTGKTGSFVDIYANGASNDTEYGSSINVNQKGVGINTSFTDTNAEFGERLASIDMNNNDVSISLESTANGNSTAMVINTSGVTINDERVLTEGNICYVDFIELYNDDADITIELWYKWVEALKNNAIFYASRTPADDGLRSEPLAVLTNPFDPANPDGMEYIKFYMHTDYGLQSANIVRTGENEFTVLTDAWTYEVDNQLNSGSTNPVQNAVITQALNNKLDASAYTPTDLSEYWTSGQTQNAINAATSGIPSSQVIEQLRTDINTVSGDVENKQDALVYYSENTENKSASIHIENTVEDEGAEITGDLGVDGYGVAMFSTKTQQDVQDGSTIRNNASINTYGDLVSIYYEQSVDDELTTHSNLEVGGSIALSVESDVDPLPYSHLNVNKGDISLEVMSDEDHITTFAVSNSAVTINDERVLTEADLSAVTAVSNDLNTLSGAVIDNEYTVSQAINSLNNRVTAVEEDTLTAGSGISISNNVISTSGVVMSQQVAQIVKLTQAQYSALSTKDNQTLYIVVD